MSTKLIDSELHILLMEVESIVNSRLLTDVLLKVDNATPLTPNHLFLINHDFALPPFQTYEEN